MSRKRTLDEYLESKTRQLDEVMNLAREDRLRFFKEEWTKSFYSPVSDELRVSVATKTDTSAHNARARINFADQNPTKQQILDLQRKSFETACDRFKDITQRLDEVADIVKQLDSSVLPAFNLFSHSQFLADLANGTYDRDRDLKLVEEVYGVEPAETKTAEIKAPTETKTEPIESKTETKTEAESTETAETKAPTETAEIKAPIESTETVPVSA